MTPVGEVEARTHRRVIAHFQHHLGYQPVAKVVTAFDRPCIPADCVATRSHTPGMLPHRAWSGGRRNGLGARGTFTTDCYTFLGNWHEGQNNRNIEGDYLRRFLAGQGHDPAIIPGSNLIGFIGTPLLKSDKQRSVETFGPYIHTYKSDEAVGDEVVLDLRYEARGIDHDISSEAKIDQWLT